MDPHGDPVRYEKTDTNAVTVVRAMVGLAVVAVATAAILIPMFGFLESWTGRDDKAAPPVARFAPGSKPPKPWLQEQPFKDIQELHAHEAMMLGQYGWADRGAGVIRMPIADAMTVVLERGLPVRETAAAPLDDSGLLRPQTPAGSAQ
ncbi:MAG: hypothetical protein NDJ94_07910 [Vicinamibacteria bacterium]|nr:hypothetical protein [Vicinamibacteria bacterium]